MAPVRRQRGGETVEFALLAWLVFLLLFGMIGFLIALYNQGAVLDGVRDGTREAALYWVDQSMVNSGASLSEYRRIDPQRVEQSTFDFINSFGVGLNTNDAVLTIELCRRDQDTGTFDCSEVPIDGGSVAIQNGDRIELDLDMPFLLPGVGQLPWLKDLNRFLGSSVRYVE